MTYSSAVLFSNVMQDFKFGQLVGTGGYARARQSGGIQFRTLPNTGLSLVLPRMIPERPAGKDAPPLVQPDIALPDDPFDRRTLIGEKNAGATRVEASHNGYVGRFGLMICYDGWYPEVPRTLAWMGAEVILQPTLTKTVDREQELVVARANAIVNQVWLVTPNYGGLFGTGRSLIVDRNDKDTKRRQLFYIHNAGSKDEQIITIADRFFEKYSRSTDFIQRYVFPGGMLPSPEILKGEIARAGLVWRDARTYGADYARTLKEWRGRFLSAWDRIEPMGFDERFKRMWDYYLCYCEAGFEAGLLDVGLPQIVHDF